MPAFFMAFVQEVQVMMSAVCWSCKRTLDKLSIDVYTIN